jgi:hypothetical protein
MPDQTFGVVTTCRACGSQVLAAAEICPTCGVRQHGIAPAFDPALGMMPVSDRRIVPAALLCFFLGVFGAHRFYVGRTGSAIVQLLTVGGLGLWMLADLIMILTESFRDAEGRRLTVWT